MDRKPVNFYDQALLNKEALQMLEKAYQPVVSPDDEDEFADYAESIKNELVKKHIETAHYRAFPNEGKLLSKENNTTLSIWQPKNPSQINEDYIVKIDTRTIYQIIQDYQENSIALPHDLDQNNFDLSKIEINLFSKEGHAKLKEAAQRERAYRKYISCAEEIIGKVQSFKQKTFYNSKLTSDN